tara:strand:- start:403 stop:1209 length:807 start_codon:yes stop_codon:yes gene_type:complete
MVFSKKGLIKRFKLDALSGWSSVGAIRFYKDNYNLDDDQIEWLIEACNFNSAPSEIDPLKFYNCAITKEASFIDNPHVQLYCLPEFISPIDRELLIGYINQKAEPCKLATNTTDDENVISQHRTSSEIGFSRFDHTYFSYIDDQFVRLMNLSPFMGGNIHGQKYEIGQFYKQHIDYYNENQMDTYCKWMGQRTWTTMLYLNDVEEGGETHFIKLGIKLKPKAGTLIAWNNLNKDGSRNTYTDHEALAPISGKKYILTKWWRSWPLLGK